MIEITVYGPGCAKCVQALRVVEGVVSAYSDRVTVCKVTDLEAMIDAGIMSTPAIALGRRVLSTGVVPSRDQVVEWIERALK